MLLLLRALEPPWFNQYVMKYFLLLIMMMMMMMMLMDEADTLQHQQNCTEQTGPVKQFK